MNPKHYQLGGLKVIEVTGDPNRETIILFHGYGADASDLVSLSSIYQGPTWIFPQAPLEVSFANGFKGRAWFPVNIELLSQATQEKRFDEIAQAFPSELDGARRAVENLLASLQTPMSHIILGGFSQGAVLAVETALHAPLRCGALLIFSGTLINEHQWRRLAPLHANTPFFQSHGSNDLVLPLQKAEALADLLISSGLKGALHPFHGGHTIPFSIFKQLSSFLSQL